MKIVIIGGVAGGATAAARLRRRNEHAEIVIYERSGYVSYANCGLPYYVGGVIDDEGALTLQTPEGFRKRFRVDVHVRHEVTRLDPVRKAVTVHDLEKDRTFETHYDKLLLAPGARPVIPPFLPHEVEGVFTLRTVEDTLRIDAYRERHAPRSAIVIGGGFIGLEMAENLRMRGLAVTVLQRGSQLLNTIDADIASFVHPVLTAEGIRLCFGANVREVRRERDTVVVTTEEGATLSAELVILAVGVSPDTSLARDAGLALGQKGAIAVNDRMETSARDVYAVGDAVEITHALSGTRAVIALAGPANKQARIAADNICGDDRHYRGALGTSVIKLFNLTVASTGLREVTLKELGIAYEKAILAPLSHAGYYPGATVMTMKVLFEKESARLLGAQIVGRDGVDKRIDVLATAITAGMRADELCELDLAYAPPYGSAKDPVNLAGFIADNIMRGIVKQFYYEELPALRARNDVTLLDTRTDTEYLRGHADGFSHIPLDSLRDRLCELDKAKPVYVMCQSGLRSYLATRILVQNGFDAYNFAGGYRLYQSMESAEIAAATAYPCGAEKPNS